MKNMDHDALTEQFDELQKQLVHLWDQIGNTNLGSDEIEEANTVIVLPSMTVDEKLPFPNQQGYEERMLFMLFLLRQPQIRIIYLTSVPIPDVVVEYYLGVLPSVTVDNARRRLFLVSPQDASEQFLVAKILERPKLIEQIRSLVPMNSRVHLVPFLTTDLERELAVRLGVPMYAADPQFYAFGTKSGCRRLFREEGLSYPIGEEDVYSENALSAAIARMRAQKPGLRKVIVKLNEGVSGFGNAQLSLENLPNAGSLEELPAIKERLKSLQFELAGGTYDWYIDKLEKKGGIVEELISGDVMLSPSAQMRVTPIGEVELLSTHDQMLGGPTGQIYLGARFPADRSYGPMIMAEAKKIGDRLAKEGVVGRFALDFLVVKREDDSWEPYAIEINLRKGGTTHPFLALQYLTDGVYDAETGVFKTALGHEKFYVATDALKEESFHALTPEDVFDLVSNHRLHYDHTKQTGIVLHMISPIAATGKVGLTAIENSPEAAEALYQRFGRLLREKAAKMSR